MVYYVSSPLNVCPILPIKESWINKVNVLRFRHAVTKIKKIQVFVFAGKFELLCLTCIIRELTWYSYVYIHQLLWLFVLCKKMGIQFSTNQPRTSGAINKQSNLLHRKSAQNHLQGNTVVPRNLSSLQKVFLCNLCNIALGIPEKGQCQQNTTLFPLMFLKKVCIENC